MAAPSSTALPRTLFLGLLALALLLRLLWPGLKPPHFDEGVNGFFVDQIRETGLYRYDPSNYHGPLHLYVLYLMQTLFGRSVEVLRLPMILVGTATVWLILEFRRFLPWKLCAVAAAACAVSPAMIFYSRYAIHEAWLVFALLLTLWGAAELWTHGSTRGLWAVVMGPTLAILTKETYLIHFTAFGLAWGTLRLFERFISPSAPGMERPAKAQWGRADLAAALSVGLLWIVFFYSGGFRDFSLLTGLYETFNLWAKTGTEGAHEQPWYEWLRLMAHYELPALAGAALGVTALLPGMNRLVRFTAIWGLGVLVAYSIIPYKTPWCIIAMLWPFYFVLGDWACRWSAMRNGRIAQAVVALSIGLSLIVAIRLNYFRPTDPKEPYVYVQTTNDLFKLTRPLMQRARQIASTYHAPVHLLMEEYHPLPWVLGDFTKVYYAAKPDIAPPEMDALIIIAEEARIDEVEAAVGDAYFVESFRLRNELPTGRLYLNAEAFSRYFGDREPELNPQRIAPLPPEEDEE